MVERRRVSALLELRNAPRQLHDLADQGIEFAELVGQSQGQLGRNEGDFPTRPDGDIASRVITHRAIEAGKLAIVDAVAKLGPSEGQAKVRIGIATGAAVVGDLLTTDNPGVTDTRNGTPVISADDAGPLVDHFRQQVVAGAVKILDRDLPHTGIEKAFHHGIHIAGHGRTGPCP